LESKVWDLETAINEQRADLQARLDTQAEELGARLANLEKQCDLVAAITYLLAGESGLTGADGGVGQRVRHLLGDLRRSGVPFAGPHCRCGGCACPWPSSGRDRFCYACRLLHRGRRQAESAFARRRRHRRPPVARLVASSMSSGSEAVPEPFA
jgi:hypothetical protein